MPRLCSSSWNIWRSFQFVIAYYAILRADAVVVPINPMNLAEELRHYFLGPLEH